MPFSVKKGDSRCGDDKPWSVVNSDTGKLHGCHPTEAAAKKQVAALYANVPDAKSLAGQVDELLNDAFKLVQDRNLDQLPEDLRRFILGVSQYRGPLHQLRELLDVFDHQPVAELTPDESMRMGQALGLSYFVQFDYRSDGGPMIVGTFNTRDSAVAYVNTLEPFESEWSVIPLTPPT